MPANMRLVDSFAKTLSGYKEAFLKTCPSSLPEVAAVFIGGGRLFTSPKETALNASWYQYEAILVVDTKEDMCKFINNTCRRRCLLAMMGIDLEDSPDLRLPESSSGLYAEFDAVRITGYDEAGVRRVVTILSLDIIQEQQDPTRLNIVTHEDQRVFQGFNLIRPSQEVQIIQQATEMENFVIRHEQLLYTPEDSSLPDSPYALGPTAHLLLSSVCVYGNETHGKGMKRHITSLALAADAPLTVKSMVKSRPLTLAYVGQPGFAIAYADWLGREMAEFIPDTPCGVSQYEQFDEADCVFVFAFGKQACTSAPPSPSVHTSAKRISQETLEKYEQKEIADLTLPQQVANETWAHRAGTIGFGNNTVLYVKSSPYLVGRVDEELKGALLAAKYFPRTIIPLLSASKALLYPYLEGPTQSEGRLSFIDNNREDERKLRSLLHMELIKTADTLAAYRRTLPLSEKDDIPPSIHVYFHENLKDDKMMRDYYGQGIKIGDHHFSFEKLLYVRWKINGKYYPPLREALDKATAILSPTSPSMTACPTIFGLGSAHGNKIMATPPNDLTYLSYEVAGFHPVMLDMAKPMYHDVFFHTQFRGSLVRAEPDLVYKYNEKKHKITVTYKPCPDKLSRVIMAIKQKYLLQPLSRELQATKGVDLRDHVQLLTAALFACAIVSEDLVGNESGFVANVVTGLMLLVAEDDKGLGEQMRELGFEGFTLGYE